MDINHSNDNGQSSIQSGAIDAWKNYTELGHFSFSKVILNVADVQYLCQQWRNSKHDQTSPPKEHELRMYRSSLANEETAHALGNFMSESQTQRLFLYEIPSSMIASISSCFGRLTYLKHLLLMDVGLLGRTAGRNVRSLLSSFVCCLTDFDLYDCTLDLGSCMEISEGLKESHGLRRLNATQAHGVGVVELRLFLDGLANSHSSESLIEVHFKCWPDVYESSIESLTRVLNGCRRLENLTVSWCNIFKQVESDDLKYLDFIRALQHHKSLKGLEVDAGITDDHAAPLFRALEGESCSLIYLALTHSGLDRPLVRRSLVASLPSFTSLEKLVLPVDWNSPKLLDALRKNASLIEVSDVVGGDMSKVIQPILRRNKAIRKTLPKLLANRRKLTSTIWPFCVHRFMVDSDDMTPVFLFAKATLDNLLEGNAQRPRKFT